MDKENKGYFTLFVGKDNQYYFSLKAGNHEIILQSEGYTSKSNAINGIESVQENCTVDERYKRKNNKNGNPYFVLIAKNGEPIGKGEDYSSEQMMEKGINSVKRNGLSIIIKDETKPENSDKEKCFDIIVNGRPKQYLGNEISYNEVVKLAYSSYLENDRTIYTVTYSRGAGEKPTGTLVKGQLVKVKSKMIFNVTQTDKS